MSESFRYQAFISYAHVDEKWAAWLHRALESYRVPKHLVGTSAGHGEIPARLTPIFRDRDELATATSLGEVLQQALEDSAFQIVICSPAAARSRWTNEEIRIFKQMGRSDRILCLIVDGEPGASGNPAIAGQECFPPSLIEEFDADGQPTGGRCEPIAADARPGKDGKRDAKLKLIAGMLGLGLDSLRQRELQRRQKRLAILAAASLVGMAITSGLAVTAYLARVEAEKQRNRAETEAETARQTTQFMVDLFKVSDPSEALGNSITAREILDKGAERINTELDEQPQIQATLMDTMGTVYTSLGLYPEAARLVERSLVKRRELYGNDDESVAASLAHLGEVQTLQANYEEAEGNLRESLAARRSLFGETSEPVAESATRLADVLQRQGDYDTARELILEALDIRRQLYESPHVAIAESLEDLGLNYYDQAQYREAVDSLEQAVAMRRQLHGNVHPALAEAINNLAFALEDVGEADMAEQLYREALGIKRTVLGERHPEVAVGLNNIAGFYRMRGNLDAAAVASREALDIYRENYGEAHPDIAVTLNDLASTMYASGRENEAIDLARQSLEMRRDLLGEDHPATAAQGASLGYWLVESGDYAEAEVLLESSLRVRQQVLGEDHPQTAGTMSVLAHLFVETGRYDEALTYARRAQEILQASLPPDHWLIAAAMNFEGLALAGLGDYEAAEPLLLASLDGLDNAPIPGLSETAKNKLARFYVKWGRPELAAKYRQ